MFGHWPVGICWLYYTIAHGLLGWTDVLFGIIYCALFINMIMLRIGYGILSAPDSRYPFPKSEFERGGYAKRIREIRKNI